MPNGDKTNKDNLNKLYGAVSEKFEIGTWEEFQGKMDDPGKRKNFYDSVSERFDLGSYTEYEARLKKKELGGKGLQADWESVNKYEEDNPIELIIPTIEESQIQSEQQQQEQFQDTQLPAEVQPAEAQLPSEQEQLNIIKEVNPVEGQKIETQQIEEEKIEAAKQQEDAETAAKANVFGFARDYKSTLEEADQMNFNTFEGYANHFKDAAAKQFLLSGGDEREYKLRSEASKMEQMKKEGALISDEQIEAIRKQADATRAEKYRDIDKDISDIRDQLATGIVDDKEREALINDIKFREALKQDVFETDPAKLAKRAKETVDENENAQALLARVAETMPEGLNGKEKFDRYYNVLYKKYRDLSRELGFEVDEKGVVADPVGISEKRATVTPFMALKAATGTLGKKEEELLDTLKILERLSPTYLLNQSSLKDQAGFFDTFWGNFGERLAGKAAAREREQTTARGMQEAFDIIGIPKEQLTKGAEEVITEVGKDYTYDDWEGSKKRLAMLTSTIADIGLKYAVGGGLTSTVLKGTKIGKTLNTLSQEGKLANTTNKFYQALSKSPKLTKFLAQGVEEGLKFEGAGQLFRNDQDELNFLSGFLGSSVGKLVKGAANPMVNKVFGMFGKATPKVVEKITEIGSRGAGELAEETTQELYQIYKETDNGKAFKEEIENRFGKTSDKLEFILSSMLMGSVFGSVNTDHVKDYYNNEATPAEKAIIDEVSQDMVNDISQSVESAVEEVTTKEGIAEEKLVSEEVPVAVEKVSEVKETPSQISAKEVTEKVASVSAISEVDKSVSEVEAKPEITEKEVDTEVIDLEKPIQEIDIKEKGNYGKVLNFLESNKARLKKQRKETLGMGLPVAVAEVGLDAMIVSMKAGKAMVEVIESGRQVVINSEWYKSLSEKDQKVAADEFIKDVNRSFGIKKKGKTPTQKKIEETTEGKITSKIVTTEKKLVKRLMQSVGKGMKAGTKLTKQDIKKSVVDELKSLDNKLSKDQVLSIVSKAIKTNFDSRKSTQRLEQYINKAILDADYEAAKNVPKELSDAIKAITTSDWYGELSKEGQTKLSTKFEKDLINASTVKAKKGGVKAQVKESVQPKAKEVSVSEKKLLKERLRDLVRHEKVTQKAVEGAVKEGLEPLKGKLSKSQISSIMSKVQQTNFGSSKSAAILNEHIDKVISKANYSEDLKTAKTTAKKLKKAVKGKKVPREMEKIAKQIAAIPVHKLDSIEDYNKIAEGVHEAITGKATSLPKNVQTLMNAADTEIKAYDKSVENRRLRNEYEKTGMEAEMSFSDYKAISETTKEADPEKVDEAEGKKPSKKRQFLEAVLPFRLQEMKDMAKDEDIDLDEKQRKTINTLGDVNIDDLTTGELVGLNNILTSIIEFDSFSRVGDLETMVEATKKAKGFAKYKDRIRNTVFYQSGMTTTTFIKQIIAGGRMARQFAGDLIGDLNTGYNKAMTKSDTFNAKVNDLFKKLSPEQNRKIGMISFVVQHQGGTIEEIQAEFETRKKAVLGTVKALRTSAEQTNSKRKAKRYNNQADKIEAAYNEHLADANTIDEALGKLNKEETQTYEFLKGEFDMIKDDLADSQSRYNGKEFVEYENYLPTEARPVDKFTKEEFSIEDPDAPPGVNFVDTKQAGTTIERQPVDTEGNTVYNFDIFDMVKRKYYESVYDIGTLRERKVVNRIINNRDFKETMGPEVSRALSDRMRSMISTQKRQDYNASIELPGILKAVAKVIRLGKRVKLSTFDQVLKQPIPVLAHTAIYNNPKSVAKAMNQMFKVMVDPEYKAAFYELIAGSDVANRILLGDTVVDREMRDEFETLSDSDMLNNFNKVKEKIAKVTSASLLHSDNIAAKISWLSSYMYALQQQGKSLKDFDLVAESKNINEKAKAEADGRTDDINNVSDFSKTAELFKGKSGAQQAIREMFWNFKSFSLNAGLNAVTEVKNILNKDVSREEKRDSYRFLIGYAVQQTTFNALKIYIINGLWDVLAESIFGGEDKEESEEEKLRKLAANTTLELIGATLPSIGEEYIRKVANEAYLSYKKKMFEDQKGKRRYGPKVKAPTEYSDRLFYVDDNKMLGSYTIPEDLAKDITQTIETVASGKEFSKSDYLKLGSTLAFAMGIGDLDRLFSKAYWRVKREEKKKKPKGRKLQRSN